ncbi:membrane protein [Candidatus Omnitrophus magneticus]|uniref:Membrane protein n=1 Tax=Candidatus Omnitrophus magneticus TaxID=1609969 RepID=A0A0F0CPT4_9BACT|nr:membrane protein [Candidatus Omnitrophus magneticus]
MILKPKRCAEGVNLKIMNINQTFLQRINLSLLLFVLGFSLRFYSTGYGVFPYSESETDLVRNISFVFLAFSTFFALLEGKLFNLQFKYRVWVTAIAYIFFILLAYGVSRANEMARIRYDVASFTYFSGLLVASEKKNWKMLEKMFFVHFFVGIITNIYAFNKFPPSSMRESVIGFYVPYMLQSLLYPWPYFLMTVYWKGMYRRMLAIFGAVVALMSFIFFQKRMHAIDFSLTALFGLFFYVIREKVSMPVLIKKVTIMLLIVVLFFGILLSVLKVSDPNNVFLDSFYGLKDRVMTENNNRRLSFYEAFNYKRYSNFDRFLEARYFFDRATINEIIFGRGIGGGDYNEITGFTNLHIGLAMLVLKGGLIFLALWLFGWIMIFVDFLKTNKRILYIFSFAFIIRYLVLLTITSAWESDVWFGLVLVCTGVCMSKWIKEETA